MLAKHPMSRTSTPEVVLSVLSNYKINCYQLSIIRYFLLFPNNVSLPPTEKSKLLISLITPSSRFPGLPTLGSSSSFLDSASRSIESCSAATFSGEVIGFKVVDFTVDDFTDFTVGEEILVEVVVGWEEVAAVVMVVVLVADAEVVEGLVG